ncbi:MAG: ABC transporter permease [Planctomycetes bacterium]|nr:ABC transporter permease [Planctomycetota bacterium]
MMRSMRGVFTPPYKVFPVVREVKTIGFDSLTIICFTAVFTGMVLGLQGYASLKKFGSEGALGFGVAITLFTELGPVLSALLLIGRAGSSMCAEIGIMRNSQQIDALECMAIDPFAYFISPKLIASLISFPILGFLFTLVGIGGAYISGVMILGINPGAFTDGVIRAMADERLVRMCTIKCLVFGYMMVSICAFKGYSVYRQQTKGSMAVSHATTDAVVFSSVMVLLWDYLLTSLLL